MVNRKECLAEYGSDYLIKKMWISEGTCFMQTLQITLEAEVTDVYFALAFAMPNMLEKYELCRHAANRHLARI